MLPAPLQWYWRPTPGHTNFTLVPWAGFVFAGVAAGAALDRRADRDARSADCNAALAALAVGGRRRRLVGVVPADHLSTRPLDVLGRLADVLLPPAGDRHGLLPLAWSLRRHLPGAVATTLATIGAASLFAYWVHVELVYGGIAIPIKRRVPLELSLLATLAIAYGLSRLVPRGARVGRRRSSGRRSGCAGWSRGCCEPAAGRAGGGCAIVTGRRQR